MALALASLRTSAVWSDVLRLRHVDGGEAYYGQFANGLPSDPSYFPIGVWFESVIDQRDVNLDKDVGLNLYVVLTSNSNLSLVQKNDMHAILQQAEWRTNLNAISSPAVVGWELFDEIDMQQGPGKGYATLNDILTRLPNDRRMRYNNFGKGVMCWETDADAARFVADFPQVVSNDIYWFTDSNISGGSEGGKLLNGGRPLTPAQTRRAANYGYTVDRMRFLAARRKPVWNFVEVGWPSTVTAAQGGRAIQPAEVRAAVWHSIIAGARGIIYFNHSFGGPNQTQHCLREPAYASVRAIVKSTNEQITELAPVLNAPFDDAFVTVTSSVRAMAKEYNGAHYVFAGSKENVASTATFILEGKTGGSAVVIGENRAIPISNGRFSDAFADGNAVHIYRINRSIN
jgi:hypothetical protein